MVTNFWKKVKNNLTLSLVVSTTLFTSFVLTDDTSKAQITIPPTFTRNISAKQTFINADAASLNSEPIDLQQLGIYPGDIILLERFGYYSFRTSQIFESNGTINATFSTSNILLPNTGVFNGYTTARVPGAVDPVFPNGCQPEVCIGKIFYISSGQNLVRGGYNGIIVLVPVNARYLFVGPGDNFYADNVDLNGDLAVGISRVLP